jgi:hypothetical protein
MTGMAKGSTINISQDGLALAASILTDFAHCDAKDCRGHARVMLLNERGEVFAMAQLGDAQSLMALSEWFAGAAQRSGLL